MNRRAFLQRFGIGVSAALALASLPQTAIAALDTTAAGRRCAIEYLLVQYRAYVLGRSISQLPARVLVSPGLFEAYEGELTPMWRFTSGAAPEGRRSLNFKGTAMYIDPALTRWDLRWEDHAA